MSQTRTYRQSFGGGEVTPEFWGRIDDSRYAAGLAVCRNFLVKPQGPVENRPGTLFVRAAKYADKAARLLPFTYSTDQTMVLEFGERYVRFHTNGATLLYPTPAAWDASTAYTVGDAVAHGGQSWYCIKAHTGQAPPQADHWALLPADGVYEVPAPYSADELFDIRYVQSADVLTLVHTGHPPMELRRLGAAKWTLTPIKFRSDLAPPEGATATPSGGSGISYRYVVTTIGEGETDESVASAEAACSGNVFATNAYNTIRWRAVADAQRYRVYKFSGGVFGYIGQTTGLEFRDDNIAADVSRTPPIDQDLFGKQGDYPGAVSYFEQRRVFAGTLAKPQNIWMTKSGTESNMNYSVPIRDDDAIQFRIAAREANTIRHIVPLTSLLMLTSSGEWRITSVNSDAVTPNTISVAPQSYVGASRVTPVIVANTVVYVAARGGHLREMAYSQQVNGYLSGDLSLRAPHLFDEKQIVDMGYSKAPYPIVWTVSTDGSALGFTYLPEQQIGAWHRHDTQGGAFESVAVVAEGQDDVPYFVVRRQINGQVVRYIECLHSRHFTRQEDAFFVDCGLSWRGAAADDISGLDHLEGCTVSVLGDGAVMPRVKVQGGAVHLPRAVSVAHIGLPITADVQTLPVAFEAVGYGQGLSKNVNQVWLRVFRSSGIFAGPNWDKLTEVKQRASDPYGSPPALKTDEIRLVLSPDWAKTGQVCVRQADPLPVTLVSLTAEITLGGA